MILNNLTLQHVKSNMERFINNILFFSKIQLYSYLSAVSYSQIVIGPVEF